MKNILIFLSLISSFCLHPNGLSKLKKQTGQKCIIATVCDESSNRAFMAHSPYRMDWEYIEQLITKYHIKGLIFLGHGTKAQLKKAIAHFRNISKTPLLMCIDAEWGLNMRIHDVEPFPKAAELGTKSVEFVYAIGKAIGKQCKEIGIDVNFAPVVDVNTNPLNPVIGARSFGSNPQLVADMAIAFMDGMQSEGVIACAKHFPGHGDTSVDSHKALPIIPHTKERLESIELYPFYKIIEHKVPMIMIGHLLVPNLDPEKPASISKKIITNLLKQKMGFTGLVITDGLGMRGISNYYQPGELEQQALLAGNDLLLCPLDIPKLIQTVHKATSN